MVFLVPVRNLPLQSFSATLIYTKGYSNLGDFIIVWMAMDSVITVPRRSAHMIIFTKR